MRILDKVSHSLVSVKNEQIISRDADKVLKGGVIGSSKWNPSCLCLFSLCIEKGFSCLLIFQITHYHMSLKVLLCLRAMENK